MEKICTKSHFMTPSLQVIQQYCNRYLHKLYGARNRKTIIMWFGIHTARARASADVKAQIISQRAGKMLLEPKNHLLNKKKTLTQDDIL